MRRGALDRLDPARGCPLLVETVSDGVGPPPFEITEGTDQADLVVVNKLDLLPYFPFDLGACHARAIS